MSLRISEIVDREGTTLKVDGRLLHEDVPELARVIAEAIPPLTLDLADLQFADGNGVDALDEIRAHGATLLNVPPYVSLLLGVPPSVARHGRRAPRARRSPARRE